MIILGKTYLDGVSGFQGVATAIMTSHYSTDRAFLEPQALHEGRPVEGVWFEAARLTRLLPAAEEAGKGEGAQSGSLNETTTDQ